MENNSRILYLILQENICYGHLLESLHQADSNKYLQHMFLVVNKKKAHFLLPI